MAEPGYCSLLIYRPRKDERLSWPSWLTCSWWLRPTHISGYSAAIQVERKTGKFAGRKTDVLPLFHATKLGMQIGLGPGHIVSDLDPTPPAPKGHSLQFSAHICCGQMAGWTKTPLGRDVGLGPSDIVLGRDSALLPKKGKRTTIFGPCLLWPNGWMNHDA